MQLKKYHWKRVREVVPCLVCGKAHRSIVCLTRRGVRPKWPKITEEHQH
jgi:hypothetical protein